MKEIKAIVQHGKLQKIREALGAMPGFPGMSVGNVEGCSAAFNGTERRHSVREELIDFSPKVRIEILAPEDRVDEIVRIIRERAHTGQVGDGIVWVTPVDEFHRIKE